MTFEQYDYRVRVSNTLKADYDFNYEALTRNEWRVIDACGREGRGALFTAIRVLAVRNMRLDATCERAKLTA